MRYKVRYTVLFIFFFQAEDGIRDIGVTGVQTCALPIFECSRRYLQHLKDAFLHTAEAQGRQWDLADAQVVVTVPASFDEVARGLTAEAAEAAGLGHVTLLEEPQAAFYAWSARAGRQWRDAVAPGDVILVCDVGGGTADFSLIAVADVGGNLELERIRDRKSTRLNSSHANISYAVFCLKKKKQLQYHYLIHDI